MALASGGNPGLDLDVAAAGNSNVVRAKLRTMEALGLKENIEDILITLTNQLHLIRLVNDGKKFIYLVVSSRDTNLAIAREVVRAYAEEL